MSVELANLFELIPKNIDKEIFETLIQNEHIKVERIISKGHTSPESGWYDQAQNEWVVILKGEAIISFNKADDVHLGVGDYLNIPAHTEHSVQWTNPDIETIWLAIHY